MAPAVVTHEHEFLGTAGNATTCNAAFLATLTDEGFLRVREVHVLAVALTTLPASGAGYRAVSLRQIFYALLSKVIFDDFALPFVPRPSWLSGFVRRLCDAGMPTTAVATLHALRARVDTFAVQLSVADRTLRAADVVAIPPAATPTPALGWLHSVRTGMLRDTSGSYAQVAALVGLIPHVFIEDGHAQPAFRRAQRLNWRLPLQWIPPLP